MEIIKINNIGNIAILDEFRDIYFDSSGIEICHTSTKSSEILEKLKNDYVVILYGNYLHAQFLLCYIQRFEHELAHSNKAAQNNQAEIKRKRLYRLSYTAHKNTFPMFDNLIGSYVFQEWLSEDIQDYRFLIPARRYNRIITDIKRTNDGIYLESLSSKLYIRPFL